MAKSPSKNGGKKHEEEEVVQSAPVSTALAETGNTPIVATGLADAGQVATFLEELDDASEGRGVSRSAEDVIIPATMVLQGLSPQVDPGDPAYIPGATQGSIWIRNHAIIPGNEGILFQFCAFYKDWFEWIPRSGGGGKGGGFVAVHPKVIEVVDGQGAVVGLKTPNGTIAKEAPDPRDPTGRKMFWQMPGGNELKETRHHIGFVLRGGGFVPTVLNLTSTGHTDSKNMMFALSNKFLPSGKPLDSWAMVYRLTTFQRTNKAGKWYALSMKEGTVEDLVPGTFYVDAGGHVILPGGEVARKPDGSSIVVRRPAGLYADPLAFQRGKQLYEAVMGGMRQIDVGDTGVDEGSAPAEPSSTRAYEAGDPGHAGEQIPF